jgi:hypothetical protein
MIREQLDRLSGTVERLLLSLAFGGGLLLQISGAAAGLVDGAPAHSLPAFLVLDGLGATACTYALLRWLPRLLRKKRGKAAVCLASICFFVPALGPIALAAGFVLPVLLPRKVKAETPLITTEIPDLPYRPLIVSSQPIYGAVGLVGVIRHATDAAVRVRAVMATRQLTDQYAVPILQVALRDPVDDVRLLAYALLDSKERAIYARIRQHTARLAEAPRNANGGIHKRLAQEHWELVYLGLAQGEVRAHVLESGLKHARQALAALPRDAGLHLLWGRMLVGQEHIDEATAAFDQAEALGLPSQALVSYRAEIAFRRRQYQLVRDLLKQLPAESKRRMPMAAVVDYWGAQ